MDLAFRPEVRARVFEPYFTTKPSGHGVGLAVSLGIVEAHGGTLTVDCPPEGGAAFTFALPVGGAEGPPSPEGESSLPGLAPRDPGGRRRAGDPRDAGRDLAAPIVW